MRRVLTAICIVLVSMAASSAPAHAQVAPLPTRTIAVEGLAMRMWASGLDTRKTGQPVVVLEAGMVEPSEEMLETWRRLVPEIARFAPVVAYERRGWGMSEPDMQRPTVLRIAESLRALLRTASIAPPYILVGQSAGGVYVRAFANQYPADVAGVVLVDALDPTPGNAPPAFPAIPPNTPPGVRAELEEFAREWSSGWRVASTFQIPPGIPVANVLAAPPGRLRSMDSTQVRDWIGGNGERTLASRNALFIAAGHSSHLVHVDDPSLVALMVKHVLDHVGVPPRDQRGAPR